MSTAYRHEVPGFGVVLEVDRLRRDHHELIGELCVKCELPGVKAINGMVSTADFNFSSARARTDRARLLAIRAPIKELDWSTVLEDLCQSVLDAERRGEPALDLRELPRPSTDEIRLHGLAFPKRHPSILFGDGGSAKSYTALFLAGELTRLGMTVALFDWELCGEDHRDRLERIYGPMMPRILYCRCERPLIYEGDRLRRIVRDNKVDFAIYDSVAFACDGPPESAEIAGKYFRALREIDCGSLHIAHATKGENNDKKPFGSVFWFNGARSIWYVQASERTDDKTIQLGFIQRKSNLGGLNPEVSFLIEFHQGCTVFTKQDAADNADLAAKLSIRQRMYYLLKRGSMSSDEIALELEADRATVERTARRYNKSFIVLAGGRIGLMERGL